MDIKAAILRASFWINDYFNGSPIGKPYREIRWLQTHIKSEGQPVREKKLSSFLDYATTHSHYYKQYRGQSLEDFPVMNKLALIENHDAIRIPNEVIPGQQGEVFVQKTSGSTGTPLAVPQDTRKRQRRIAEIKFFNHQLGFRSHEKLIQLRTWNKWQSKSVVQMKRENIVAYDIKRLSDNDLASLCSAINTEHCRFMRGYASVFGRLADVAERLQMNFPSLKLVITSSEALEDSVRAKVKSVMGCECVSQYADEECGIIATERIPTQETENKMYFNYADYFIEVLKLEEDVPAQYGELGRIVLTDLHNHAFPMIRYDTGDTCILSEPDEFSGGYPVIKKLYGRRFDLTYNTKGEPVYPLAYGRTLKNFSDILQWQVVQQGSADFVLRLKLRDKSSQLKAIRTSILEIIGEDARLTIEEVEDIPVLTSGKRKPVVNMWKATK